MQGGGGGERESFLSARWRSSWHLSRDSGYGFSCITPGRTVARARAELPPVSPRHLPSTWASKHPSLHLCSRGSGRKGRPPVLYGFTFAPSASDSAVHSSLNRPNQLPAFACHNGFFSALRAPADKCICVTPSPSRQARHGAPAMDQM